MTQKPQLKSATVDFIRSFAIRNWRETLLGFLLGALLGFGCPTLIHTASRFCTIVLKFTNKRFGEVVVWPTRGWVTLGAILFAASMLYITRSYVFLKRIWISWQAGLVSGIGVIWFCTSAVTFTLLNLTASYLSLDEPISKRNQDIIGRDSVVAGILRAIISDRSPVVALTGGYGDGKTSVLKLVATALEDRKDVLVVPFSTWLPMDEQTLVWTLFNSILERLEKTLFIPNIKRKLVEFTRVIFAVLPSVPTSIKDLFRKPSQDEQICDLQVSLATLPVRVAVLLDDMDRMHKDELQALLKMIRGVPEFPQFTYVCAFDEYALVRTLRHSDSLKSQEEAQHFLEKFFPDKVPLPKIDELLLAVEYEKRFFSICDRNKFLLDPEERKKFQDEWRTIWQTSIKRYITNLRRLNLFTNRLNRILPLIGDEVNLKDLVLLELIRMINPVIYEEIFRNAPYFMFAGWRWTTLIQVLHIDENEEKKRSTTYLEALFKDLPRPPEGVLLGLLAEVFPTVEYYLKNSVVPGRIRNNQDTAERERRVFHPDFFPRYFMFQVPHSQFSEKELSGFISTMNEKHDIPQCIATFKSTYESLQDLPMKSHDFLRRVNASIGRFDAVALQALPAALAELSGQFEADTARQLDEITAQRVVFSAANKIGDSSRVQAILESVIKNAVSDRFAAEVLTEITGARNHLLEEPTAINKNTVEEAFRERMKAKYHPGGKLTFFLDEGRTDFVPLGRWALCGTEGREQVHDYLRHEFRARHSNVGKLLLTVTPRPEDFPGYDLLKSLNIYFPAQELYSLLDEYGESAYSSPEEATAVQEFQSRFRSSNS